MRFSPNWLGAWTLYNKEVRRFLKVYNQTLIAPVVNALLLLAVFSLALGERVQEINGTHFTVFMASGLIIMTIVQQAFANTSSSLIMGKVLGSIVDYLMPPISPGELVLCMVMGGITRGFMVGITCAAGIILFVPLPLHDAGLLIIYTLLASMMLSLLGLLAGIFADSFDQMAAISSYLITPLSFLSGTFYSVKDLPPFWYTVSHYNPFFYMIDGFRYSLTGVSDGSIPIGLAYLSITCVLLWTANYVLIARGYRIKT